MWATSRAAVNAVWLISTGYGCLWFHRMTKRWRADPTEAALRLLQRWSGWARWGLRLRLRVVGSAQRGHVAIVVNHRSYLDALAVSAVFRATYLARGDVVRWPLIGPVLSEIDSVFIDREELTGRARAARALLRRLRRGSVVIFPEGTTRGGPLPAEFPLGLFRLLHRSGVTIVPATIAYDSPRAHWIADLNLWQHLREQLAAGPPITATFHLGAPIDPAESASPEELRDRVYRAVAAPLLAATG